MNSPFVVLFLWKSLKEKHSDKKKQSTVETDTYPLTAADKLTLTHLKRPNVALMAVILVLNFNSLEISSFPATRVVKPLVVLE